jgi:hypothetical protein
MHPDFICIGAPKAGTGWLRDQARSHPDVWMPPINELKYLSGRFNLSQRDASKMLWRGAGALCGQSADVDFLERVLAIRRQEDASPNMEEYIWLFEPAGSKISGDVSPQTTWLKDPDVEKLAVALPKCRIIYFIREPISRLWSEINMRMRKRKIDLVGDRERFLNFIGTEGVRVRSFQSETIMRWRKFITDDRFRVFVIDDLVKDPAAYRKAVFEHIGLDSSLCTIAPEYNRKSGQGHPASLTAEYREILQRFFGDETKKLQDLVGGATLNWATAPQ